MVIFSSNFVNLKIYAKKGMGVYIIPLFKMFLFVRKTLAFEKNGFGFKKDKIRYDLHILNP